MKKFPYTCNRSSKRTEQSTWEIGQNQINIRKQSPVLNEGINLYFETPCEILSNRSNKIILNYNLDVITIKRKS